MVNPRWPGNLTLAVPEHRRMGGTGDAAFAEQPHVVRIDFDAVVAGPAFRQHHFARCVLGREPYPRASANATVNHRRIGRKQRRSGGSGCRVAQGGCIGIIGQAGRRQFQRTNDVRAGNMRLPINPGLLVVFVEGVQVDAALRISPALFHGNGHHGGLVSQAIGVAQGNC